MVHTDNTEDITMIWIDVNDSLPPIGEESVYGSKWVLDSYLFDGKQYVGEAKFIKTPNTSCWKNVFREEVEATHWMPMPISPKLK